MRVMSSLTRWCNAVSWVGKMLCLDINCKERGLSEIAAQKCWGREKERDSWQEKLCWVEIAVSPWEILDIAVQFIVAFHCHNISVSFFFCMQISLSQREKKWACTKPLSCSSVQHGCRMIPLSSRLFPFSLPTFPTGNLVQRIFKYALGGVSLAVDSEEPRLYF